MDPTAPSLERSLAAARARGADPARAEAEQRWLEAGGHDALDPFVAMADEG